jgi:uncharacterized small protein (DUF1192 family)
MKPLLLAAADRLEASVAALRAEVARRDLELADAEAELARLRAELAEVGAGDDADSVLATAMFLVGSFILVALAALGGAR